MNDHALVVLLESHTRSGSFCDFDLRRNQQCLYLSPPDVRWRGSCKDTLEGSVLPFIHDEMVPCCSTTVQVSPHAIGSGVKVGGMGLLKKLRLSVGQMGHKMA